MQLSPPDHTVTSVLELHRPRFGSRKGRKPPAMRTKSRHREDGGEERREGRRRPLSFLEELTVEAERRVEREEMRVRRGRRVQVSGYGGHT